MHALPHQYHVRAEGAATGTVRVTTDAAQPLDTHAPPQFGGPPGYWSPESLLVAAIADCYILSFRAGARASKLEWQTLSVDVEGVLDRVDGVTRFVAFTLAPRLSICAADREQLARTVLEKSKRTCLVTNSLTGECALQAEVTVGECAGMPQPA